MTLQANTGTPTPYLFDVKYETYNKWAKIAEKKSGLQDWLLPLREIVKKHIQTEMVKRGGQSAVTDYDHKNLLAHFNQLCKNGVTNDNPLTQKELEINYTRKSS